jgi:D-sedoheptulose 7-phosphate isomerase
MPMLEQRLQQQFFDSADLNYAIAEILSKPMAAAVNAMVGCITAGGKLMACGSGGSSALAQYVAAMLVGQFERDRPGLAALALSADPSLLMASGTDSSGVFARQIQSLGQPGDILLALAAHGEPASMLAAIDAAHAKDMTVIALTGNAQKIAGKLTETDVHIAVPHERWPRVQEVHLLALHCLCDAVDLQLLGEQDNA